MSRGLAFFWFTIFRFTFSNFSKIHTKHKLNFTASMIFFYISKRLIGITQVNWYSKNTPSWREVKEIRKSYKLRPQQSIDVAQRKRVLTKNNLSSKCPVILLLP
ncbi:hypothetical protein I3843_04G063800 [Carya illinoinensis]|nr:hypothetical protein I3843_04G063800 [Carya illinoinensis]